jgi:methylase of polypeptide subunit release factors
MPPVSSSHLPARPAALVNKSVLELGSGTGFLGLIVADIQVSGGGGTGHPALCLTDVNDDVLRRCHENTQLPCSRRAAVLLRRS